MLCKVSEGPRSHISTSLKMNKRIHSAHFLQRVIKLLQHNRSMHAKMRQANNGRLNLLCWSTLFVAAIIYPGTPFFWWQLPSCCGLFYCSNSSIQVLCYSSLVSVLFFFSCSTAFILLFSTPHSKTPSLSSAQPETHSHDFSVFNRLGQLIWLFCFLGVFFTLKL